MLKNTNVYQIDIAFTIRSEHIHHLVLWSSLRGSLQLEDRMSGGGGVYSRSYGCWKPPRVLMMFSRFILEMHKQDTALNFLFSVQALPVFRFRLSVLDLRCLCLDFSSRFQIFTPCSDGLIQVHLYRIGLSKTDPLKNNSKLQRNSN